MPVIAYHMIESEGIGYVSPTPDAPSTGRTRGIARSLVFNQRGRIPPASEAVPNGAPSSPRPMSFFHCLGLGLRESVCCRLTRRGNGRRRYYQRATPQLAIDLCTTRAVRRRRHWIEHDYPDQRARQQRRQQHDVRSSTQAAGNPACPRARRAHARNSAGSLHPAGCARGHSSKRSRARSICCCI